MVEASPFKGYPMRYLSLKSLLPLATLLVTVGNSSVATAHAIFDKLGDHAWATDIYQVICSPSLGEKTEHLEAAIESLDVIKAPLRQPLLSVILTKDKKALNTTDHKNGDSIYSPFIKLQGGDGLYTVFITKTAASAENYILAFHCKSANDVHTGTAIQTIQDQ
jgi:hypothetical protein